MADDVVPPDYWQAVIAALPPEKRDAAWRFYAEHGLEVAHEARDTLSGLLLLLEANGLFMERCAQTLQESSAAPARLSELSTGLARVADRLDRLDHNFRTQALSVHSGNAASGVLRDPAAPGAGGRRPAAEAVAGHHRKTGWAGRFWAAVLVIIIALGAGASGFLGGRLWAKQRLHQVRDRYRAVAPLLDDLNAHGGSVRADRFTRTKGGLPDWIIVVNPGEHRKVVNPAVESNGTGVITISP
ncbi:MAG: hypothetical protein JO015_18385 [Verrucomicrobia bacterium]|nr:hypothetical protein [Verrucomicrobiota bacterium]